MMMMMMKAAVSHIYLFSLSGLSDAFLNEFVSSILRFKVGALHSQSIMVGQFVARSCYICHDDDHELVDVWDRA